MLEDNHWYKGRLRSRKVVVSASIVAYLYAACCIIFIFYMSEERYLLLIGKQFDLQLTQINDYTLNVILRELATTKKVMVFKAFLYAALGLSMQLLESIAAAYILAFISFLTIYRHGFAIVSVLTFIIYILTIYHMYKLKNIY